MLYAPFNFLGSLVEQVNLLVRGATRKDKSLAFSRDTLTSTLTSISEFQRDIESSRLKNDFVTRRLTECSTASLVAVSESFENGLQQVEHFYHLSYPKFFPPFICFLVSLYFE